MKDFSVGVVGLGYWGPNILRNIIDVDKFKDIYCYDTDRFKMDKNKRRFPSIKLAESYNEIINNYIESVFNDFPFHQICTHILCNGPKQNQERINGIK